MLIFRSSIVQNTASGVVNPCKWLAQISHFQRMVVEVSVAAAVVVVEAVVLFGVVLVIVVVAVYFVPTSTS
jgi:hypothetical protein